MQSSTEEENFIVLIQALRLSNSGLKHYVDFCLEDIYSSILRNVSNVTPICNTFCNSLPGNSWCAFCTKWKTEIESYVRLSPFKKKISWQDIDFGKLTGPERDLAKTELFSVYVKRHLNSSIEFDIQAILSLFQNCVYFDIGRNKPLLDSVRNIRNKHFAHTVNFDITKKSLEDSVDKLIVLFQHPSILSYGNSKSIIAMLKKLRKKNMELVETSTHEVCRQVFELQYDSATAQRKIDKYLLPLPTRTEINRSRWGQCRHVPVFLVILISFFMAYWLKDKTDTNMKGYWHSMMTRNSLQEPHSPEGCKTIEYDYPFAVDIDFEFYRSTHDKLVGRKWLLHELENVMSSSSKGVMFIAEMGYGKSAIMSHLVCQDDRRDAGYQIYQNISVFHICTFESQKTLLPGSFVKNMAAGFAKYIPKFQQYIEQNRHFKDYFEGGKCLEDAEGCLDFLVIKTLHQLKNERKTHIVVIDALDECMEYDYRFNIVNLVLRRITKFPKYIKFLTTSRNISRIAPLSGHLNVFEQKPQDEKNIKDIGLFVWKKLQNAEPEEISNLKYLFISSGVNEIKDKTVKYGKGNMLFVLHALKLWTDTEQRSLDSIPNSLESLFYNQLLRIFGNDDAKFRSTRKILEILCASTEPLTEIKLFEIANISEADQMNVISLIGNELSHFIRLIDGKFIILHRTLSKFLTRNERRREQFYISEQNGCAHLSYYVLQNVRSKQSFNDTDILQLTEYVSCSKKQELKNLYLVYGKNYSSSIHYKTGKTGFSHLPIFPLHRAALKLNSYSSMSLFLDLYLKFPSAHVDENDDGNITASYVAAAYGNHGGLLALLKYGANVNFTRLGPRLINSSFGDLVEFSKLHAQWEYNLLNIASQNGHLKVVRILIRNQVDMKHMISCGLDSFQLASEFGQMSVVKYFLMDHKSTFHRSLNFSLYLTSKNGHEDIVSLLLYHGAVDICLPCTRKMHWTTFHQTRLQVIENEFDLKSFNYIFEDDRRMIRCETALEIAIQNGYTEVVKRLIQHSNSSLLCRDSGGRTPLLTAARFDRTDILEFFMSLNVSFAQYCFSGYQNKDGFELSKTEELEYDKDMCLNRMSVFHLVAEYGSLKSFLTLYDNFKNAFLTERDKFGSTPLHYLACQGRVELIRYFEINCHIKSYNGSTLLHSAAICKQYTLLDYLLNRISQSPLDDKKQSFVHYLAQSESFLYEKVQSVIDHNQPSRKTILQRIRKELFFRDAMERTALHYAAIHGNINFLLLSFELDWDKETWKDVFEVRDINNRTVLDLLFEHLPPYDSSSTSNYFIINPHQYFISFILKISFPRNMMEEKLTAFCAYSVRRGYPRILEILLTKYQEHGYAIIHIYECLATFFHILSRMNFIDQEYFNILHFPTYLICDCNISKMFAFHELMEDRKGSFREYIKMVLNVTMNCKSMDYCYDDEGYNPLHRAVIGGNFDAFQYLIDKGMSVNVTCKDGRDILQLLIEYAPCIPDDRLFSLHVSDIELSGFLRRKYRDIGSYIAKNTTLLMRRTPMQICNNETKYLSTAHVVAAKGLLEILQAIKEQFGETYSYCLNNRNISTAHLLTFFGHSELQFQKFGNFSIYLMNATAALYLKFVFDFKTFVYPRDSFFWKCKHRARNFRNMKSLLNCASKAFEEQKIVMSQSIKVNGFKSVEDIKKHCGENCKYFRMYLENFFNSEFQWDLKYLKNPKKSAFEFLLSYKKQEIMFEKLNCKLKTDRIKSKECIKILSEMINLKKIAPRVFLQISMNIPIILIQLYEHKIMRPFQFFSNNFEEVSHLLVEWSIILSGTHPGFQFSKEYDYWDVIRRNGDTRVKKMVKKILNSSISEIQKWKGHRENRLMFHDYGYSHKDLPTDKPLHYYEQLQESEN